MLNCGTQETRGTSLEHWGGSNKQLCQGELNTKVRIAPERLEQLRQNLMEESKAMHLTTTLKYRRRGWVVGEKMRWLSASAQGEEISNLSLGEIE